VRENEVKKICGAVQLAAVRYATSGHIRC